MSTPNRLIFRVKDIAEEYAIVSRMLCPSCEHSLARERQTMLQGNDKHIKGDLLELRCTNNACRKQVTVFFYLPEDYDPARHVEGIARFFPVEIQVHSPLVFFSKYILNAGRSSFSNMCGSAPPWNSCLT